MMLRFGQTHTLLDSSISGGHTLSQSLHNKILPDYCFVGLIGSAFGHTSIGAFDAMRSCGLVPLPYSTSVVSVQQCQRNVYAQ